jgi:hypothetical protein
MNFHYGNKTILTLSKQPQAGLLEMVMMTPKLKKNGILQQMI